MLGHPRSIPRFSMTTIRPVAEKAILAFRGEVVTRPAQAGNAVPCKIF
jgi:hypothetical protein